jgi:hemerythrin-like domain-containing protein
MTTPLGAGADSSRERYTGVMFVKIGQPADHGFDEPLGLLSDCHRRIEQFLGLLSTVARNCRGGPLDAGERRAVQQALRYFATAAPRHTADEEISLFPRLRACGEPATVESLGVLDELEADHRLAEQEHATVDALANVWLAAGVLSPPEVDRLLASLEDLQRRYARHIAVEDRELFPAASRVLTPAELEAIGREMADRRNVPFRPRM